MNLYDILECGDVVYSLAHGYVDIVHLLPQQEIEKDPKNLFDIGFNYRDAQGNFALEWVTKEGKLWINKDAECILYPSKENRDWSTWKNNDFKKGALCLFWDNPNEKIPGILYSISDWNCYQAKFINGEMVKGKSFSFCQIYGTNNHEKNE